MEISEISGNILKKSNVEELDSSGNIKGLIDYIGGDYIKFARITP